MLPETEFLYVQRWLFPMMSRLYRGSNKS